MNTEYWAEVDGEIENLRKKLCGIEMLLEESEEESERLSRELERLTRKDGEG